MKRIFCALLAALLVLTGIALAEDAEILDLKGEVTGAPMDATPEPELPDLSDEDEAEGSASAAPSAGGASPLPTLNTSVTETPEPGTIRVGFEDGFALRLPEGWLMHPTDADMAAQGVVYCLSDASGKGWLYVQSWETDCADMSDVQALIERAVESQSTGIYSFNGCDFVVYDLIETDVSCCATLLDGRLLNLVFAPQSDQAFMAVAAKILNTFELL